MDERTARTRRRPIPRCWCAIPTLVLAALAGACDEPDDGRECVPAPGRELCTGVGTEAFVASGFHLDGVSCGVVRYVAEGAADGDGSELRPFGDLPAAAAVAAPGDCIALAPGQYTAAPLSGSVSLLGAGARLTGVAAAPAGLVVRGGAGAVIRGLEVTGDGTGLRIEEAEQVRVEDVRVAAGAGVGIQVLDATDVAVVRSHVAGLLPGPEGSAVVGLYADRAPGLQVESTLVEDVPGPGIVIYFSDGAALRDCVARDLESYGVAVAGEPGLPSTRVTLDGVAVTRSAGVGIWMQYVLADLVHLRVEDVGWDTQFARGLELYRSEVEASAVEVSRSVDLGVFLVRTPGHLADATVRDTGGIGLRLRYLAQDEVQEVTLERLVVEDASNTALMASGPVRLALSASQLRRTRPVAVMVDETTGCEMADGLAVLDAAAVDGFDLTIAEMPRHALLLDAAGEFFFTGCTFDAVETPAVVQNVEGYDPAASFVGDYDAQGALVYGVEPEEPVCSLASPHQPL